MKVRMWMFLFAVAALAGVDRVDAQANWYQASIPTPRCCMGMAFDVVFQGPSGGIEAYTLMFGGVQGYYSTLGDTWKLTEGGWFQLSPASSPSPRDGPGMAYDAATGTVVLFAGSTVPFGSGDVNDTWIWDGKTWTQVTPPLSPGGRRFETTGMVYDAATRSVVLFGGTHDVTLLADTWTWNGRTRTWTQHSPAASPAPGSIPLAYDAARGGVVAFDTLGRTWLWNGANWQQSLPASSPPPRGL